LKTEDLWRRGVMSLPRELRERHGTGKKERRREACGRRVKRVKEDCGSNGLCNADFKCKFDSRKYMINT